MKIFIYLYISSLKQAIISFHYVVVILCTLIVRNKMVFVQGTYKTIS
jgi:hypothetical protein